MAKISNNVIAVLLLAAIAISGAGIVTIITITAPAPRLTGAATGVTNLTVQSLVSIRMIRNISDFGSGTPEPSGILHLYTNTTNTNGFKNGTEGNGTNYGGCDGTESKCVFPFVIENDGNDDSTCVKISGNPASTFIGGTNPEFHFAAQNNETGACASGLYTEWQPVTTSETNACESLHTETGGGGANTIRIHWHIGLPSDTPPETKTNIITISAYGSC